MNDPTSILGQAQQLLGAAGNRGAMVTTTRRCLCVLVLVLLFLAVGFDSTPSGGTPILFGQGLTVGDGAKAATLAAGSTPSTGMPFGTKYCSRYPSLLAISTT